ncbi:very short patch repair endonuclease [[Clostridium] symbiosum]|uniref:very short patch repair endonuclease n=1 Tax=Clostridium symbiosum TaxID=1512 RepID=UPI00210E5CF6|nr:very short patch repair endonuclease [[Clostridium] symbiosum]MCQ4833630.1 very short patch repair endonuclease [[Clostridium] symbiosum]
MDVHTKETRSYNMSRIRNKNTKPEELVRKYLFRRGLRYRKNVKKLPGCPDIVLPRYNVVVFVNGCFWHVHEGCKYFKWPQNNKEFWETKLTGNKKRDAKNISELEQSGWKVLIVWECELKKQFRTERLNALYTEITGNE